MHNLIHHKAPDTNSPDIPAYLAQIPDLGRCPIQGRYLTPLSPGAAHLKAEAAIEAARSAPANAITVDLALAAVVAARAGMGATHAGARAAFERGGADAESRDGVVDTRASILVARAVLGAALLTDREDLTRGAGSGWHGRGHAREQQGGAEDGDEVELHFGGVGGVGLRYRFVSDLEFIAKAKRILGLQLRELVSA